MKKSEYMERAFSAYNEGRISQEAYDAAMMNIDIFCDDEDEDERFPEGYCEIEYDDMESCEAVMGTRFDDMNYLRYLER